MIKQPDNPLNKICSNCHEEKHRETEFYSSKLTRDKRQSQCKTCMKSSSLKSWETKMKEQNPDYIRRKKKVKTDPIKRIFREVSGICKQCDDIFTLTRRWQVFCSDECREAHHRTKKIVCPHCQKEFSVGKSRNVIAESEDS